MKLARRYSSESTEREVRPLAYPFLRRINTYLVRWLRKKYKTTATAPQSTVGMAMHHQPIRRLFAHWTVTCNAW